ncbi:hypothetical protein [Ferrovibrio sp.]|uniref:hypothetical protein n=1 Tax=Ferrovibrio sp. TaxID=1917215 RepID=UPI003519BAAB
MLIDRSVRVDAITTKIGNLPQQVRWGPTLQAVATEVEEPKAEPEATATWKRQQIAALPKIGDLMRSGRIEAFTYFGLKLEDWLGSPGLIDGAGNALRGVNIQKVEPAFDPTYLFPMAFDRASLESAIIQFVGLIVRAPVSCWDTPKIRTALAEPPRKPTTKLREPPPAY